MPAFELPQRASASQLELRHQALARARDDYQWAADTGLPPHALQLPPEERLDGRRKKSFLPRVAHAFANRFAAQATSRLLKWDSVETFGGLFPLAPRPKMLGAWQQDSEFARQRVAGINPIVIARCDALPDNFRIAEGRLARLLPEGASLAGEIGARRVFVCDYVAFDNAACVPGRYLAAPIVLFHKPVGAALRPIAIQLGQNPSVHPVVTPNDGKWAWLFAKTAAQSAHHHHQQMLAHLLPCHYFMEPFWVAANRQLAPSHPVRELLAPHFRYTMYFDEGARDVVCSAEGSFPRLKATGLGGSMAIMRQAARTWRFSEQGFSADLARRGVASAEVLPDYPYRDDGLLLHASIDRYVADMLALFYTSPQDLLDDAELQAWVAELVDPKYGGIKGLPGGGRITSLDQLRAICTDLIFRASAYHAAISDEQADEMTCVPNLPFALYRPLPKDINTVDEAFVMAALPGRDQAIHQVFIVHVATSEPVHYLGTPNPNYWRDHPAARARRAAFATEMQGISRQIDVRNRTRPNPYRSLDPMRVSESIAN